MEETHNTLKFANRAKRVEIFASRNKIIDEKSLIKKYQREISSLKQELDLLKKGMLVGVNHEEIINLRQQLEEGQVKMQSRLEEEEEAKVALTSRIQRLTKLILVSSKNSMPGCSSDVPSQPRNCSLGDEDNFDVFRDVSLPAESENLKGSLSSVSEVQSNPSYDFKQRSSLSKWNANEELSSASSTVTESNQGGMTMSDQMDFLVEQVKMLSGEIAFSTSTLKRLVEQSVADPENSKTRIQSLEHEIQEKKKQMRVLEQRITESREASVANASLVEMQQTITRLMAQCNEKGFDLEIKSADNRILQEQLQNKSAENKEIQDKLRLLQQQLTSFTGDRSSLIFKQHVPGESVAELKKKIQSQEIENEKLKLEHVQLSEENTGLRVQNQKLAEEASYAKELASAAAVELKNLAGEVSKLSVQNAKLEKELSSARATVNSRSLQNANVVNRKHESLRPGRKGRSSGRLNEMADAFNDEFDSDDLKFELQARKQREAALEAALAEKEFIEDQYRKKIEVAKKKEEALENDLANMWVLVAKLKKEGGTMPDLPNDTRHNGEVECFADNNVQKFSTKTDSSITDRGMLDISKPAAGEVPKEEPLVLRLKAKMQEMKEKELKNMTNGDVNSSNTCKVCFESPTAAILLPCRHFCLCKSCSLACSECPICRTNIADRLFAFTS